jgi:hypothetical protein
MNNDNKEFYELLNSLADNQTFTLNLTPSNDGSVATVSCKALTTAQLRKLIETVVDSPLTQATFNSTVTQIFKQSLVSPQPLLNVVDRLLFILETRIQSLSPTTTVRKGEEEVIINFSEIKADLEQKIKENMNLFLVSSASEGKVTISFGPALIDAETQLNEEIYKNLKPNLENPEELRKILGDTFINEIAKAVRTITINEQILDLSTVTFKSRLEAIESLPASLIQKVIEYIEKYRNVVDNCLVIDNHNVVIDGSLFSLR